jgi:hypothetical protein
VKGPQPAAGLTENRLGSLPSKQREWQLSKNNPGSRAADLRTGEVGIFANQFVEKRFFQEGTEIASKVLKFQASLTSWSAHRGAGSKL